MKTYEGAMGQLTLAADLTQALADAGLSDKLMNRIIAEPTIAMIAVKFLQTAADIVDQPQQAGAVLDPDMKLDVAINMRVYNIFMREHGLGTIRELGLLGDWEIDCTRGLGMNGTNATAVRDAMARTGVTTRAHQQTVWDKADQLYEGHVPLRLLTLFAAEGTEKPIVSQHEIELLGEKVTTFAQLTNLSIDDLRATGVADTTIGELRRVLALLNLLLASD